MKRIIVSALVLVFAVSEGVTKAKDEPNPTGTWKWTVNFGGQSREAKLKLKLEADKLTGTVIGRNNQETAIEDGKYKDSEVSFHVTRERDGQKFTIKYRGKVRGDEIKGKIEFEREGQTQSIDWDAKREKE
jgi:hypothetical protein